MRKSLALLYATLALSLSGIHGAQAQTYPSKPIRIILGLAAGGSTDITARLLAEKLRPILGQPAVVENRPGAGTLIAAQAVAQSPADGHTLLFGGSTIGIGPYLYKAWTLDGTKDFSPITQLVKGVTLIGVQASAPYNTLDEWIAYLRANPGKLNYANISPTDLVGFEMIKNAMGVKFETIRYGGATPAQAAVLGAQADFYAVPVGAIATSVFNTGKVKFLAVQQTERSPIMPNIPSFGESSHPELRELGKSSLQGGYWFGVGGPGGMARAVVDVLHGAAVKVSADPEWIKRMADNGLVVMTNTPEQFAANIVAERTRFAIEAKKAGIEPL